MSTPSSHTGHDEHSRSSGPTANSDARPEVNDDDRAADRDGTLPADREVPPDASDDTARSDEANDDKARRANIRDDAARRADEARADRRADAQADRRADAQVDRVAETENVTDHSDASNAPITNQEPVTHSTDPRYDDQPDYEPPSTPAYSPSRGGQERVEPDRATVMDRQQERFGGVKVGSAFFGWLTSTGMAVILIAFLAAGGVAFGVVTKTGVDEAVGQAEAGTATAQTVGLVGGILLLVIVLAAYFCGGYVAGRMARFNGLRQGLIVWLWGIVMALVIAGIAAIAGSKYDVFAQLDLPRLPVNEGQVTTAGLIAIGAAIVAALIGALLGGLAGMRFHRRVDAAGFDAADR